MANLEVGLVRRVKTDAGWKRFPAVYTSNGRVKSGLVLVDGEEVKVPAQMLVPFIIYRE